MAAMNPGVQAQIWRWHFWIGLLVTPILVIVSITGALYAFEPQLRPLLEPEQTHPACSQCNRLAYAELLRIARAKQPELQATGLKNPGPGRAIQVTMSPPAASTTPKTVIFLDPFTGDVLGQQVDGSTAFDQLLGLHRRLLGGQIGNFLVELSMSWVLVTLLLGLLLWWPKRRRGPGSWWLRSNTHGRKRWRDLHTVLGLYLLPLALLLVVTGLFFSPLTQRSTLGLMYLAGQIPELYLQEPEITPPPQSAARQPLDGFIEDFYALGDIAEFSVHIPAKPSDPVEISAHIGQQVWRLQQAFYDPYTGERVAVLAWSDLAPGAKALLLFFPLHTGNILGIGTQILACLASLAIVAITFFGIWMWWLRRQIGSLGAPPRPQNRPRLGIGLSLAGIALGILFPAFGLSCLVLIIVGMSERWIRRKKFRINFRKTNTSD